MTDHGEQFATLSGKRVFLTGHTGFKGSWLVHWLSELGCDVAGYALAPETQPNHYELAATEKKLRWNFIADIRDADTLSRSIDHVQPDIVMHLAAQAIVHRGYADPVLTWGSNVMGTVNVLNAIRTVPSVGAAIVVTTDKVYENNSWQWGYREIDALGGSDPYSASKAASEFAIASFRKSYFANGPLVASARAGNVIGGGDWSANRLVADVARAVADQQPLLIRNPNATRPWQHVLDCLSGYSTLASALLSDRAAAATAFNFGPATEDNVEVQTLISGLQRHWPELRWRAEPGDFQREAAYLYLDSTKAHRELNWTPRWSLDRALEATADWYRTVLQTGNGQQITERQLQDFLS